MKELPHTGLLTITETLKMTLVIASAVNLGQLRYKQPLDGGLINLFSTELWWFLNSEC